MILKNDSHAPKKDMYHEPHKETLKKIVPSQITIEDYEPHKETLFIESNRV